MSNNLFIIDKQDDRILSHINKKHVIFNEHEQDLSTYRDTFRFTVLGDKPYAEYLTGRNGIIAPGEDGELLEFRLQEVHKYKDHEGLKIEGYAWATFLDLKKARKINPHKTAAQSAEWHAKQALVGMEWQVGNVAYKGVSSITFENYTNPYDYLLRIAREFELELRFYITHDGSKITGRFVDLIERVGEFRGRTVEFGHDLQSIRRIERTDNVVTALYGIGPEREDGTRLEVFVEDREALERWGRNGQHIIDIYEPMSERSDMTEEELRQYTRTELNKRINAVVSYEANILDLENVPGLENKKIRFGDTIRIKDLKFNPALYVEARVHNQVRDVFNKDSKRVILGDYQEFTEEELTAIWKQLRQEIQKKISLAEMLNYAEPKRVESDSPPPIEEGENPIWIDTSKEPSVAHVVVENEWKKITPTKAEEVNAPSRDETIIEGQNYNGLMWDKLLGLIIELSNGKARSVYSGNKIAIQKYDDATENWVDQFYVDENGNVIYAGELEGASGRFGKVTVKDGDLVLEDSNSGQIYSLIPKTNLVRDHGFELCKYVASSINVTFGWADFNPSQTYVPTWVNVGNPKITFSGLRLDTIPAIFGNQSAVVNNANYLNTLVSGMPNAEMTVSAYFMRHHNLTGGAPKIVIKHVGPLGNVFADITEKTFPSVPTNSSVVRHSVTFTVPSNFDIQEDSIQISVMSGNQYWVKVDGVQAVFGSLANLYHEDSIFFQFLKGSLVAQLLRTEGIESYGNVRVTNGYVYSNIFSHTGQGQHLFFRTNTGYEVRIVDMSGLTSYARIRASEFLPPESRRENKKDIDIYDKNVLEDIRKLNIYTFRYNFEDDNTKKQLGVMLDEVPEIIRSENDDTIRMYSTIGFLMKAIKDLTNELDSEKLKRDDLEKRIQALEGNAE